MAFMLHEVALEQGQETRWMYCKGVYVDGKAMRQFKGEDGQKTEDGRSDCMRGKEKVKRNGTSEDVHRVAGKVKNQRRRGGGRNKEEKE